jgi:hypothetical protein
MEYLAWRAHFVAGTFLVGIGLGRTISLIPNFELPFALTGEINIWNILYLGSNSMTMTKDNSNEDNPKKSTLNPDEDISWPDMSPKVYNPNSWRARHDG